MAIQLDNRVALENDAPRADILEKVTGKAKYTTDYYLPQMMWAAYIRSPGGRVQLRTPDLTAAKAVPGVLEIEIKKSGGGYHGDRLGHICADSRQALEEAMAALNLKFDQQTPRTSLEKEMTPLESLNPPENDGEVAEIIKHSELVVEAVYSTQVQTHCCLEAHGAVVDHKGSSAVGYGSTQSNIGFRDDLAQQLGLKANQVQSNCEYVGGGFGSKFGLGVEGRLASQMSLKYGRPCRVICNRKEEQIDTGNRPGSLQSMKLGLSLDGSIRGGRIATWGSVGPTGGGQSSDGGGGGGGVRNPSRYQFGTIAKTHEDVTLNGGYPTAMRAPGHPQAMFAIELMMDLMAEKVGIDPLEFRIKNEKNATRQKMLRAGAELIGWSDRQPAGSTDGPMKRGYGIGVADWWNSPGEATIAINVYRDGTIEVLSGAQDIGMGYRTLLRDILASQIGVPHELIVVKVGRGEYPPGPASGGSVTSRFTAPRAFQASDMARNAIFKLVAKEWGIQSFSDLECSDGFIKHQDNSISWLKACRLMNQDRISVSTSESGPYWKDPTQSEAVQFAEVNVDVETGIVRVKKIVAIQSVGLPVNRLAIENQVSGAVIQGLSYCLFENRILDRNTGTMVNANMDMYKIAGPLDVPEIVPIIWKPDREVGVNSVGEPPVIPTAGAIATAVANAIGVQVRSLPITPDKVLSALAEKEKS
ncbi:xanthine dehydrogenase family protein molybdopterin-binding subunit [Bythopirellula goksoeyrii]|uniref:Xanthine dehydrogenase molybdenum-binding subunit n=1 Tax=Bythopirellula goksoeyrii TaxID=1400387 RepID=A0A5B9Q904_9BACT|nr:xanthine dehydrogenase family protein molybdopterin-binding subunit [Bythopirellula goksoeyrii]QEG33912.1 Xanthine dehydrogenase molybdenum-binding subunit [Bythopirellula goksoeyrii]